MLKVTNTEVFGWMAAIRGMRNPRESWDKSDSGWRGEFVYATGMPIVDVGPNDLTLMKKLIAAGNDHSKFMRMIHVQCDWEAPLYWWKEADTYKVGTVRNSCSTMHTITEHEFTFKDFACEHLERRSSLTLSRVIDDLNYYRDYYLSVKEQNVPGADAKAKEIWWQIIQLLPSSYLQKATMDFNYAVLRNMYHSRNHHKQDEWREDFCNWVKTLPYSELITMTKEELLDSIKEE
jgi:hypothetical protein